MSHVVCLPDDVVADPPKRKRGRPKGAAIKCDECKRNHRACGVHCPQKAVFEALPPAIGWAAANSTAAGSNGEPMDLFEDTPLLVSFAYNWCDPLLLIEWRSFLSSGSLAHRTVLRHQRRSKSCRLQLTRGAHSQYAPSPSRPLGCSSAAPRLLLASTLNTRHRLSLLSYSPFAEPRPHRAPLPDHLRWAKRRHPHVCTCAEATQSR